MHGEGRRPNCAELRGSTTCYEQAARDSLWDLHFQQTPAYRTRAGDASNLHMVLLEDHMSSEATAPDRNTQDPPRRAQNGRTGGIGQKGADRIPSKRELGPKKPQDLPPPR